MEPGGEALVRLTGVVVVLGATMASAGPRTLVVGAGDCQSVELVTGVGDFNAALKERLKADLYESDVVLDIVRPRPTRSPDDVERLVESARTLFYNGQNERSLELLKQALSELERAPLTGEPWKVMAQALTLKGVVLLGLGKRAEASESFKQVLRVEPGYALNKDEFAPSIVSQFEGHRKELARQKKTAVTVQSTPAGGQVLVEGRAVGVTPVKLELATGAYRVTVRLQNRHSFLRVVQVPREAQLQVDLASEGALAAQAPLCLDARERAAEAAALKLANTVTADDLVLVRHDTTRGGPGQFVASRYEIRTGSMVREGRVQVPARGKPAFADLANFLLTGQGSTALVMTDAMPPSPAAQPAATVTRPPPSLTPGPTEPPAAPAVIEARGISLPRVVSYTLFGAGAVGVGTGLALFFAGGADRDRLAQLRQPSGKLPDPSEPTHREALDTVGRIDANQRLAFAVLGAGLGAATAGLVTFLFFPAEAPARVVIAPNGMGVVASGSF